MHVIHRCAWIAFNIVYTVRGHLFTSVITVIEGSPTTTPCSELNPSENREQWAQQCAMARTNILPTPNHDVTLTRGAPKTEHPRTTQERTVESFGGTPRISTTRTHQLSGSTIRATPTDTTLRTVSGSDSAHATHGPDRPTTLSTATTSPSSSTTPAPDPTSRSSSSSSSSSSSPNLNVILGSIFGVLALLALLGYFLYRKNDTCRSFLKSRIGSQRSTYTRRNSLQESGSYLPEMSTPGFRGGRAPRGGGRFEPPMTGRSYGEGSVFSPRDGSPATPIDRGMVRGQQRRSFIVANPDWEPPSASAASGTIDIGYNEQREQTAGSPQSWTHSDDGYDINSPDEQQYQEHNVMSPASARSPGSEAQERPTSGIHVISPTTNASNSGSESSVIDELGPEPTPGPPPVAYTPYTLGAKFSRG